MTDPSEQVFSKENRTGFLVRLWRMLRRRAPLFSRIALSNLRLGSALDPGWRDRYERARTDLFANDVAFRPSRTWTLASFFYRLILRGRGLKRFKSTFGPFWTTYEPHNPLFFQAAHHLYRNALKERDVWGLLDRLEEPQLGDGVFVDYRGKRLSIDLLQSVDEFYRLREILGFAQEDRVVFCELGAGYGRLADCILSAMPNAVVLIFDLPESLLLSQYYLTSLHPADRAALYPESAEVLQSKQSILEHRLVFGLPHQLQTVPKRTIDAFINIFSFMEMGRPQVEHYFRIIDGLEVEALYIKQHKVEVNPLNKAIMTEENYPVQPGWERLHFSTTTLFEHAFEAVYRVRPAKPQPALQSTTSAGALSPS